MNWLESLLWDPTSVAHIVCLYAFVISVGVLLGKIKVFGVSLGVTFVLFTGILMGHFGFTGEIHILHFIREFGLILFVFCIGLQVGPSFFSSFKKGGMTLNMLAVGIVALNIVVALGIYFIDGNIDLPMIVGILYSITLSLLLSYTLMLPYVPSVPYSFSSFIVTRLPPDIDVLNSPLNTPLLAVTLP